ncbi:MAG: squalene/phytoene synthase family protein [Nitrospira sp.]|nr:MAG: squalene/phytoene synthase family protein [Nitrospira sp.]
MTQPASYHAARLLTDLLKRVSRSFYLTLAALPSGLREAMGLGYLFARAADTIADTDLIPHSKRLELLLSFRAQFVQDDVDAAAVKAILTALLPHQHESGERTLLEQLPACFGLLHRLPEGDQDRIRGLMPTLTRGMELDLAFFPGDSVNDLTALPGLASLDQYTYFVAGCVGEFWTAMTCAHRPSLAEWNVEDMSAKGVRFGKGLQLTNVLKDVAKDLQRGRCYLPQPLLAECGLIPADLLKRENIDRARPVIRRLAGMAVDHLDVGWAYTMAIPRREVRLRLACMWPILLAGETLARVVTSPDLLDAATSVKVSRGVVYRVMASTILTGACGYVGTAYWGRLRKQIV